jgi:hypothetical protein
MTKRQSRTNNQQDPASAAAPASTSGGNGGSAPPKQPKDTRPPTREPAPATGKTGDIVDRYLAEILSDPTDNSVLQAALRHLNRVELSILLSKLDTEEARKAYAKADASLKAYRHALHCTAGKLCAELNAAYGLRREFGADDGHGVYVEGGPLGTDLGAGVGHVLRKKTANGGTRAAHTGIGVYLRTTCVTKQAVSSPNRLMQLAAAAAKAQQAAAAV